MPASCAPAALVLAHVRSPALQAFAPLALVLAEARLSKLQVCAPDTLVLAEDRPPPLLLCAPDAIWGDEIGWFDTFKTFSHLFGDRKRGVSHLERRWMNRDIEGFHVQVLKP